MAVIRLGGTSSQAYPSLNGPELLVPPRGLFACLAQTYSAPALEGYCIYSAVLIQPSGSLTWL
jgi:hypothetical protein